MASGNDTAQQVHVTQMVRPLVEAIDAALDRHHEEIHKSQQAPQKSNGAGPLAMAVG